METIIYSVLILIACSLPVTPAVADKADTTQPCTTAGFRQFDFWLGTWDLTWAAGDSTATGTNIITAELGDCVIEENFTTHDDNPFMGRSLSVYNPKTDRWSQTWVDNSGNYLDFEGRFTGGRMILERTAVKDDQPIKQRMVFYNITAASIDWNWERSTDDGRSWMSLWQIHYQRRR